MPTSSSEVQVQCGGFAQVEASGGVQCVLTAAKGNPVGRKLPW